MASMKVVLNILTHGDEVVGLRVAKRIQKLKIIQGELIVHKANELAYRSKKRFIDQDLNRSFPGNKKGNHEQRLAANMLPLIKSADVVIDIHSTTSGLRDALIVTKINKQVREYIDVIAPKYLLYMRATRANSLLSAADVGVAFEYGRDNDKKAEADVVKGIQRLLHHLGMVDSAPRKNPKEILWFDVFKMVPRPRGAVVRKGVKNYQLVRKGEVYGMCDGVELRAREDFYPILFGERNYNDIFGFVARTYRASGRKRAK
jgi:predicted deacylase